MTSGPEYVVDVLLLCLDRHFDDEKEKGKDEDTENNKLIWRGSFQTCRPVRNGDKTSLISMRIFSVGLENTDDLQADLEQALGRCPAG